MPDISEVLKAAVGLGASDIHLIVGNPPMARVKGDVVPLPNAGPLDAEAVKSMAYSVLTEGQRGRFEEDLELDCSFAIPGVSRFRLNCYQHKNGVGAVMRVIPAKIPTPQELGLSPAVIGMVEHPRGLVLVTGPTGSGKSTTLACMIEGLNAKKRYNIITIEDPIEFVYQNKLCVIQQREVGQDTKSFREALRHALRQDPDVLLIGEMRDLETIALALTAAETGHLVLATLHTQDAATSIDRIIDVFPDHQQEQIRVQLATSLQGVVAQLLLQRKDGNGRVAAREVMTNTPAIANLIREGKAHMIYSAIETSRKFGMISMDQYLSYLIQQGLVSQEEALPKAHDPQSVAKLIGIAAQAPA